MDDRNDRKDILAMEHKQQTTREQMFKYNWETEISFILQTTANLPL